MRIPCGYPHPIRADLDLDLDVDTKVVSADEDMSQSIVVIRGEVAIWRYDSLAARSNAIIGGGMLRYISRAAQEVVLNMPTIL